MRAARRGSFRALALLGALVVAALAACDDGAPPTSRIFQAPPWGAPERYRYQLVQRSHLYGHCELRTEPEFEPGQTRLERLCGDDEGFRDDGSVIVDSRSLAPRSSKRVNVDPQRGRTAVRTAAYEEGRVTLRLELDGETRTVTRDLPKPTSASPEPGWYDDESMLWLVRGVPLQEGWEGAYHNVSVGTAQVTVAEVTVLRRARVTVPAGQFETWEVLVRSSITNRVWVNQAPPHQVVKAQIEQITYELVPE